MTLEEVGMDESELMNVREKTLKEQYSVHDIGQGYLRERLDVAEYTVVEHGDDARHTDTVYYGDGPDLAVYDDDDDPEGEDPLCYIEVKTKRIEYADWFCRLNRRHWNEYVAFNSEVEAPVFLYFAVVDEDVRKIFRDGFVQVCSETTIDGAITDVGQQYLEFPSEAIRDVKGTDGMKAVTPGSVENVSFDGQVVSGIPDVHGNDVVAIDDTDVRNLQWLFYQLEHGDG